MSSMESKEISQLEKLKQQKEKLEAKIQQTENRLKQKKKKEDTRRKILLGAYYLEKLESNGGFDSIKSELDSFLTRESDRKLFGLTTVRNLNV